MHWSRTMSYSIERVMQGAMREPRCSGCGQTLHTRRDFCTRQTVLYKERAVPLVSRHDMAIKAEQVRLAVVRRDPLSCSPSSLFLECYVRASSVWITGAGVSKPDCVFGPTAQPAQLRATSMKTCASRAKRNGGALNTETRT